METYRSKNSGKKASFNIIDVFILVFVIACFLGIIIRVGNFSLFDETDKLDDYRIGFSVSDISAASDDYFKTGDTVTIAESGIVLGRLEMINSIEPSKVYVKNDEDGFETVKYPYNTRIDVCGTLISKGMMNVDGYKLGGNFHVASGDRFLVHTEHMNFVLTVTDISKK